jgi:hypothetical protein
MTKNAGNVSEVMERLERSARIVSDDRATRQAVKKVIADHERKSGDGTEIGGTGLAYLKFQGSPLSRLADRGSIGTDELRAAEDIYTAYMAISGELWLKAQKLEKSDKTNSLYEPHAIVDSVKRYRAWANHWSVRKKRGDQTLPIAIDVVIDERPLRAVEEDYGLKHGRAAVIVGSALRDYLARAGWASKEDALKYMQAAESNFCLRRERPY